MKYVRMLTRYLGTLRFVLIEIMMLLILYYLIYTLCTDKILSSFPMIYAGTVIVAFYSIVRMVKEIYIRKQGLRFKGSPISEINIEKEYKCIMYSSKMLNSSVNKSSEARQQQIYELNESFKKMSFYINRIKKDAWLNMESIFILITDVTSTILVVIMFLAFPYGIQVVKTYILSNNALMNGWYLMLFICCGIYFFISYLNMDFCSYEVKIKDVIFEDSYYFITIAEDERRKRIREYDEKRSCFKRLCNDLFDISYKVSEIMFCSFIALFSFIGVSMIHPCIWNLIEILLGIWILSALCRDALPSTAYIVDKDVEMQDIVPMFDQIYIFEKSENDKVKILLKDQKTNHCE